MNRDSDRTSYGYSLLRALLAAVIFKWFINHEFLLSFLGLFLALPILIVIQTWVKEVLIKDILDGWQTAPSGKPSDSP